MCFYFHAIPFFTFIKRGIFLVWSDATPKSDAHGEVDNLVQSQAATACVGSGCWLGLAEHSAEGAHLVCLKPHPHNFAQNTTLLLNSCSVCINHSFHSLSVLGMPSLVFGNRCATEAASVKSSRSFHNIWQSPFKYGHAAGQGRDGGNASVITYWRRKNVIVQM